MAIIGSGGAGKSTLANDLAARTGLPVIHLDERFWAPGWVATPDPMWDGIVRELAAGEAWIMDGNYSRTLPIRLARADTVVFLDLPRLLCIWRVTRRWLRFRGRSRPDMPAGVNETLRLAFLRWIWDYPRRTRPEVLERLAALPPTTRVERLRSPREVRAFLKTVPQLPETAADRGLAA